jgi:hypothetical protein
VISHPIDPGAGQALAGLMRQRAGGGAYRQT